MEPVLLFYMLGICLLFSVFHNFVSERACADNFTEEQCADMAKDEAVLAAVQAVRDAIP